MCLEALILYVQLCCVSAMSEHMHRVYPLRIFAFPCSRQDGTAPPCTSLSTCFARKVIMSVDNISESEQKLRRKKNIFSGKQYEFLIKSCTQAAC